MKNLQSEGEGPGMKKIAVLIPCYNEEKTVAAVVGDFRRELPGADIYVYDNNSTDGTAAKAREAGAILRRETRQGKGNVVRAMFGQIDADIYVLVDGDGTYPADKVHELIRPIVDGESDIVHGSRLHPGSESSFKQANLIGNKIFLSLLNVIFGVRLTDLLTGYRSFSRGAVKGLPVLSSGFEIETEMTMQALERGFRILEVPVDLSARPEGSRSKIRIFRDGFIILNTLLSLFRDYKPLTFFSIIGFLLIVLGLVPGFVVVREFLSTGFILHIPSAILAVGLVLSGLLVAFVGLILHTITRRFQEISLQIQGLTETLWKGKGRDE